MLLLLVATVGLSAQQIPNGTYYIKAANGKYLGIAGVDKNNGAPLIQCRPERQLPSEGTVRGTIQIPPAGMPVILGPDHPVTGGYPVIGVVIDADTDDLAQVRPGQSVRLSWAESGIGAQVRRSW